MAGQESGRRVRTVSGSRGAGWDRGPRTNVPFTAERRERSIYFAAALNGDRENFYGPVLASESSVEIPLSVHHLAWSSRARAALEVALQGVSTERQWIRVWVNGLQVGEVELGGTTRATSRLPVALGMLREGDNEVRLENPRSGVSVLEYVRLTYPHTYMADQDALRFVLTPGIGVTVEGFSDPDILLLDVTDPLQVTSIRGRVRKSGSGYSIEARPAGPGRRTLLAVSRGGAGLAPVVPNSPSVWHQSEGAELVIISHRDFVESVQAFRDQREAEGWTTALIDVADIYDEFSFGHKTPLAIRAFLRHAWEDWQQQPTHVLLVGDASYDPKNYLGAGAFDFVPTRLVDTPLMETASDDWLVDTDGDGLAEMAVGRIPARTAAEAQLMFAKILDNQQLITEGSVVLVADEDDDIDFAAANTELGALLPQGTPVQEILRGQLNDEATRLEVMASLNQGPGVVNYLGHGSVNLWRGNLLTSEEAAALHNGSDLSLYVMMTCLNGYFQAPGVDSLGESLLKAEQGGAAAVWASSSMTGPEGQFVLNQALFGSLFGDGEDQPRTLGEAIQAAKRVVSEQGVRGSWVLLGDPTMSVR